jgi:hypothetical protein
VPDLGEVSPELHEVTNAMSQALRHEVGKLIRQSISRTSSDSTAASGTSTRVTPHTLERFAAVRGSLYASKVKMWADPLFH